MAAGLSRESKYLVGKDDIQSRGLNARIMYFQWKPYHAKFALHRPRINSMLAVGSIHHQFVQSRILMTADAPARDFLAKYINPGASRDEARKVRALFSLSLIGVILMGLYSILWFSRGNLVLGFTDMLGVIFLYLNLVLLRYTTTLDRHIYFGLTIFALLLLMLFWNGSMVEPTYLWLFCFPAVASFLLGSKKAAIASLLLLFPAIIFLVILSQKEIDTNYSLSFGLRLVLAYAVIAFMAYRFERAAEKRREDYESLNNSLERTVQERTKELVEKNAMLAKEVAKRTAGEKRLALSVKEKEILLKEVHHRTKNNMNVIISLLNLQKWHMKPDNIEEAFSLLRDRIYSMATVHERLYRSENMATLDLSEYILDLVAKLRFAYAPDTADVDTQHQAEKVEISLDKAIPLGLILNEIITNAFKHGVVAGNQLVVKTLVKRLDGNAVCVEVSDNGPGLPHGFDPESAQTLGMHLIHILVTDQLAGSVEVSSEAGVRYRVTFELEA